MPKVELVVIGASAGGLVGLLTIVKALPPTLPAAVVIVMHTNSSGTTYLPDILSRASRLPVHFVKDGQPIEGGQILIAPPDFHVVVARRSLSLTRGPRENGFRPAIDPLFRTASRVFRKRVMGIILSGALDDGTYGMSVIQDNGGVTVVQDPDEAQIPSMPMTVMAAVNVDHVLKAAKIAEAIVQLTTGARASKATVKNSPKQPEPEPQDADSTSVEDMMAKFGSPSALTCPDCGGALWDVSDEGLLRYRCHVGHQFSADALDSRTHDIVEGALWKAVRVLEEQSAMKSRLADRAKGAGLAMVRKGFAAGAHDSHRQAEAIRDLLFSRKVVEPGEAVVAAARSRKKSRRVRAKRAAAVTKRAS